MRNTLCLSAHFVYTVFLVLFRAISNGKWKLTSLSLSVTAVHLAQFCWHSFTPVQTIIWCFAVCLSNIQSSCLRWLLFYRLQLPVLIMSFFLFPYCFCVLLFDAVLNTFASLQKRTVFTEHRMQALVGRCWHTTILRTSEKEQMNERKRKRERERVRMNIQENENNRKLSDTRIIII